MPRTDVIKCVFVSDYWNDCIDDILFLCNLLEKRYVILIISWHCSLGGNFLADTLRHLRWPALSRSWHLAASGMGLRVMSHQTGLLTTGHHIHICFPEQGGNMVTTMGWGFSDFRHLFFLWSSKSFTLPQPANHLFIKINLLRVISTETTHACRSLCW